MKKYYKVWIHIEEIDEDKDIYEDVGLPTPVGESETLEGAVEIVSGLTGLPVEEIL